jgi:hypothetical protein
MVIFKADDCELENHFKVIDISTSNKWLRSGLFKIPNKDDTAIQKMISTPKCFESAFSVNISEENYKSDRFGKTDFFRGPGGVVNCSGLFGLQSSTYDGCETLQFSPTGGDASYKFLTDSEDLLNNAHCYNKTKDSDNDQRQYVLDKTTMFVFCDKNIANEIKDAKSTLTPAEIKAKLEGSQKLTSEQKLESVSALGGSFGSFFANIVFAIILILLSAITNLFAIAFVMIGSFIFLLFSTNPVVADGEAIRILWQYFADFGNILILLSIFVMGLSYVLDFDFNLSLGSMSSKKEDSRMSLQIDKDLSKFFTGLMIMAVLLNFSLAITGGVISTLHNLGVAGAIVTSNVEINKDKELVNAPDFTSESTYNSYINNLGLRFFKSMKYNFVDSLSCFGEGVIYKYNEQNKIEKISPAYICNYPGITEKDKAGGISAFNLLASGNKDLGNFFVTALAREAAALVLLIISIFVVFFRLARLAIFRIAYLWLVLIFAAPAFALAISPFKAAKKVFEHWLTLLISFGGMFFIFIYGFYLASFIAAQSLGRDLVKSIKTTDSGNAFYNVVAGLTSQLISNLTYPIVALAVLYIVGEYLDNTWKQHAANIAQTGIAAIKNAQKFGGKVVGGGVGGLGNATRALGGLLGGLGKTAGYIGSKFGAKDNAIAKGLNKAGSYAKEVGNKTKVRGMQVEKGVERFLKGKTIGDMFAKGSLEDHAQIMQDGGYGNANLDDIAKTMFEGGAEKRGINKKEIDSIMGEPAAKLLRARNKTDAKEKEKDVYKNELAKTLDDDLEKRFGVQRGASYHKIDIDKLNNGSASEKAIELGKVEKAKREKLDSDNTGLKERRNEILVDKEQELANIAKFTKELNDVEQLDGVNKLSASESLRVKNILSNNKDKIQLANSNIKALDKENDKISTEISKNTSKEKDLINGAYTVNDMEKEFKGYDQAALKKAYHQSYMQDIYNDPEKKAAYVAELDAETSFAKHTNQKLSKEAKQEIRNAEIDYSNNKKYNLLGEEENKKARDKRINKVKNNETFEVIKDGATVVKQDSYDTKRKSNYTGVPSTTSSTTVPTTTGTTTSTTTSSGSSSTGSTTGGSYEENQSNPKYKSTGTSYTASSNSGNANAEPFGAPNIETGNKEYFETPQVRTTPSGKPFIENQDGVNIYEGPKGTILGETPKTVEGFKRTKTYDEITSNMSYPDKRYYEKNTQPNNSSSTNTMAEIEKRVKERQNNPDSNNTPNN